MLQFRKSDSNIVKDMTFPKEATYLTNDEKLTDHSHDAIAEAYSTRGYEVASVLIAYERLHDSLWDDPLHCRKTNHILVSRVREEARSRLVNRYHTVEQCEDLMKRHELHDWETNYKQGEEKKESDRRFKIEVEDCIFQAQEEILYPEIVKELTADTRYVLDKYGYPIEDEDGEYVPASEEVARRQYLEELERIFMPRMSTRHERVIHMPRPFNHWDYRNNFQQYFLMDKGKNIQYVQGGSGSSGQREHQGRYAHVFATLENEYGYLIPTFTFLYNARNEMVFLEKYDSFKAINRELKGNYPSDKETVSRLFKGRLLYKTKDHVFKDVCKDYFY